MLLEFVYKSWLSRRQIRGTAILLAYFVLKVLKFKIVGNFLNQIFRGYFGESLNVFCDHHVIRASVVHLMHPLSAPLTSPQLLFSL